MISIAGDHKTVELIKQVEQYLQAHKLEYENLGAVDETFTPLQAIIPHIAKRVRSGESTLGILACGTGVGVEIGANRFRGVRASLCIKPEQAGNARTYDDANILCLSAWETEQDLSAILDAWFSAAFDGSTQRAQMLSDFDAWQ
jgi:ribose 5-phosphate isomerase B